MTICAWIPENLGSVGIDCIVYLVMFCIYYYCVYMKR
jgi:hypothetical protein